MLRKLLPSLMGGGHRIVMKTLPEGPKGGLQEASNWHRDGNLER